MEDDNNKQIDQNKQLDENKDMSLNANKNPVLNHDDLQINLETLLENPELKKQYEQYSEKQIQDEITKVKRELKKQYEDEKKKEKMTQEELLQQKEMELQQKELKLNKIQYFKDKEYDLDLLDFVYGEDINEAEENADKLISIIDKVVEKKVAERLKQGYVPHKENKKEETESIGHTLIKQLTNSLTSASNAQKSYFE